MCAYVPGMIPPRLNIRLTVFLLCCTKLAKSPPHAKVMLPYFGYSVIRGSARKMTSRTRRKIGSAGLPTNHFSASGSFLTAQKI